MTDTVSPPMRKPSGWLKWLLNLPVWVYRARLGWLFNSSLVVLVHRGRKTGAVRRTVLEALAHRPIEGEYRMLSGRGRNSDWFRNMQASPPLELWVGRKRMPVTYRVLGPREATESVRLHIEAYPRMSRRISPELVAAMEQGTLADVLTDIPVVALKPIVIDSSQPSTGDLVIEQPSRQGSPSR